MRSWGRIDAHDRGDVRGLDFASKGAMIALDRGHDRVAIGPLGDLVYQPFDSGRVERTIAIA